MLDKKYNYLEKEEKWQNYWFDNDIYKYDLDSPKATYSIDTPPPTCNGKIFKFGDWFKIVTCKKILRYKKI